MNTVDSINGVKIDWEVIEGLDKVRYLVSFKILGIFKILFWKFGILKVSFFLKSVFFPEIDVNNDKIQTENIWLC